MKRYTAREVIEHLRTLGFEYTVHGLRKQLEMGCVPSFKIEPNKKKTFDDIDLYYIELVVFLRAIGGSLLGIKHTNNYIYKCKQSGKGIEKNHLIREILAKVDLRKRSLDKLVNILEV